MNPTPQNRAEEVFANSLDLPAAEREAFIAKACEDSEELLSQVQGLIKDALEAPTKFHDPTDARPLSGHVQMEHSGKLDVEQATPAASLTEKEGDIIGPYKLLQEIGEGGFGTVWMAEQSKPIARTVALKVIKAGMDTREVLGRFEVERQALAMMDHPNIARVYDAGATSTGRPWFVMELVKGVPITRFCDEQGLGTKERLEIFRDVCSAINHAHQKGIIHRDIKPSNVMISLHGDKPVVKVIDFGIAKATQGKLTDQTLFTRVEQFMGTPVYMSPEQASLSGFDIDTRSDIYTLGVLLYELLTGKPPFDHASLASAGYDEMRRIIAEEEPPIPSSRLSTVIGEERDILAKARHIEPEKLIVDRDLDWIVMKAIEKDRTRRYETANALAQDITRFLEDEPVSAMPPSSSYRFRKFARRNKGTLTVAATFLVFLVVGAAVSTWQAVRATRAEQRTAETLAEVAAERDAKEQALEDAEAISTFLTETFQSPDPTRDGRTITVAETIDTAAEKLETELAAQPERRAKLQTTLAQTYHSLGLFLEAVPLQEKAWAYHLANSGSEHPDTLREMHQLASFYFDAGRLDKALEMREQVLEARTRLHGPEHPDTLLAMSNLAVSYKVADHFDEALTLRETALPLFQKVHGPEHPDTLRAMQHLAASYADSGQWEKAIPIEESALALRTKVLGPEHPDTLASIKMMAFIYHGVGNHPEALRLQEKAYTLRTRILGPEHPDTISAMASLADDSYHAVGRHEDALLLCEKVLTLRRKVLGEEHPDTLTAMGMLARSYHNVGRTKEAVPIQEKMVELRREEFGPEHNYTLYAMANLAEYYHAAKLKDKEPQLLEELLTQRRKVLGLEHPDTLTTMGMLARAYHAVNRTTEAIPIQEEMVAMRRKTLGPDHKYTLSAMTSLANYYRSANLPEKEIPLLEELLPLHRNLFGPDHSETLRTRRELMTSYRKTGDHQKAESLEKESLTMKMKQFWGARSSDRRVAQLGELGLTSDALQSNSDGTWSVNIRNLPEFSDLSIFQGMPVVRLTLSHTGVTDLVPLQDMPLKTLILEKAEISDLRPLRGMKLEQLILLDTKITDLAGIEGMPLRILKANNPKLSDLEPIQGMPLETLDIGRTAISDISVLRGMPLSDLRMRQCPNLTDLSPLTETKGLTILTLPTNAEDFEFLRNFSQLKLIGFVADPKNDWVPNKTAAEFWKEYDSAKLRKTANQ